MSNKISKFVMTSSLSQSEFFFRPDTIPTQRTCETSHKNISHSKYEKFYKLNSHVYLAYFRSYSLFKISKCIGMYWKINFKIDRTPWKMHVWPWHSADRFFREFCESVVSGERVATSYSGGRGGGGYQTSILHTYALQTRLVAIFA